MIKAAKKPASIPNKESKNIRKTIATASMANMATTISIINARNLIKNPLKGDGCIHGDWN